MKKKIIGTTLLLLWVCLAYSQNLVPNNSFESGICPDNHSQMDRVSQWYSAVGEGTSDYFNECYQPHTYKGWTYYDGGAPRNHIGYQKPRTGRAYVGCHMSSPPVEGEYREYIGVELTEELKKGSCYYFEMYVSLADSSAFAISTIGAHFSKYKVVNSGSASYITTPQILNNTIITDTSGWVKISGNFIAGGGEKYMMIGNFAKNNIRQNTGFPANSQGGFAGYYYIDDVLLKKYDYTKQLTDTLLCPNTYVSYDVTIDGAKEYKWSYGAETPVVKIVDAGYYYVDIKVGGCTFRDEANVDVYRRMDEPDRVYCSDRGEQRFIDISDRGDTFLWNDGISTPNRFFDTAGQYYIIITDQCGNYRDDIAVSFYNDCNALVHTPTAFTPNNDGLNDGFKPIVTNVKEYEFMIFNRWGQLIFRTEDITQEWDGTYQGKLCPGGTYMWMVNYGNHLKSTKLNASKSGSVTLLR